MSHFKGIVIGKFEGAQSNHREQLAQILAPYLEKKGNINSKYDWYKVGGRYENQLPLNSNQFEVNDGPVGLLNIEKYIENRRGAMAFCVVTSEKWEARANMGWFAITTDEKNPAEWELHVIEILRSLKPRDYVWIVDFHI